MSSNAVSSNAVIVLTAFLLIALSMGEQGIVSRSFDGVKCSGDEKKVYTVPSQIDCIHRCMIHDGCSNVNYKTGYGAQNNCEVMFGDYCAGTTETKFWKTMRIKRQVFPKPKTHSSCKELLASNEEAASGVYQLDTGPHFCIMDDILGCGGGGWTLAIKINGSKETFLLNSEFWTNNKTYNLEDGIKSFGRHEAKFPAYSKMAFNEICIGLNVSKITHWLLIPVNGASLLDIFKSGLYKPTNLGREAWKGLIPHSSLQANCNAEGFNAKAHDGSLVARLGIFANDNNNCKTTESYLGLGGMWSSCCNYAASSPDNGNKDTRGMGYVLIK